MRAIKITFCLFAAISALCLTARGNLYLSGTLSGTAIPDDNATGTADTLTYTPSPVIDPGGNGIVYITGLTLSFSLQGGASDDLSGYLRLGNLTTSPAYDISGLIHSQTLGASPTSFSINFSDTGLMNTFNGLNPNNTWTLFFADSSNGDSTTVNNWSLAITAVPEPINVALGILGVVAGTVGLVRSKWAKQWLSRRSLVE